MRKKFVLTLWGILFAVILAIFLAFFAIAKGWLGYMPSIRDMQNPVNKFASQILSEDGQLLGTWSYSSENRVFVEYSDVSPWVMKALVDTEDARFYEHSGIDARALMRAIVKRGIFRQTSAGGGSTITQQLAKQLYSKRAGSTLERLFQKPIEWVIAVELERHYTKDEILMMYLNYFDFLHNAVGIKTAAQTYFSKKPADLTVNEAATLVGMVKNPALFNPVRYEERCRERRNVVLQQMAKAGDLSLAEVAELSEEPIKLNFRRVDHKEGSATYLREHLRRILMAKEPRRSDYMEWQAQNYYEDSLAWETDPLYGWCNKNVNRNGEHYNIYTDGLRIHTTIDSRMQHYAEEAVEAHVGQYLQPLFFKEKHGSKRGPYSEALTTEEIERIIDRAIRQSERYRLMKKGGASEQEIHTAFNTPVDMSVYTPQGEVDTVMTPRDSILYYKKFLRAGFYSMDVHTGAVKAYVGGLDYAHFQYDMAMDGRRQVGSTIKPFLYALAMENGFSPCDVAPNVQQTYMVAGKAWTPRNDSQARYGELVTLKWGLAQSNNWISAYLMSKLNPTAFVRLLHEFGILNRDIHPSMALCLGPCDISVAEMTSAYTAFANHGIRMVPMLVTRIEDADGNVVATFTPRMNEVISDESASKMLILLKGVIDQGTGRRIRFRYNITAEMGGKTGTTNRNSDGWFIGITPSLVSGAWVGGEDRDIHFNSMNNGQGASSALPIWALYMKKVYANKALGYSQDEKFDIPANFDPCATSGGDDEVIESTGLGIDQLFE